MLLGSQAVPRAGEWEESCVSGLIRLVRGKRRAGKPRMCDSGNWPQDLINVENWEE